MAEGEGGEEDCSFLRTVRSSVTPLKSNNTFVIKNELMDETFTKF